MAMQNRFRGRFIPARAGNTNSPPSRSCRNPVHPRSRGEHSDLPTFGGEPPGSSPLARGTPRAVTDRAMAHTVHPRSRGEHPGRVAPGLRAVGSSPLARGTRTGDGRIPLGIRFIPARAGNTRKNSATIRATTVHPRSRGEHNMPVVLRVPLSGSSPLARGTRRYRPTVERLTAVHPRSRGEHVPAAASPPCRSGSSPLARGTHRDPHQPPRRGRFIPARAGNTCPPPLPRRAVAVHPRSRGEHCVETSRTSASAGSSPLARGTLERPVRAACLSRFIPARAGNTGPGGRGRRRRAVHPRSRGEHLGGRPPGAAGGRFIPARAGNTRRTGGS